jgi:hypothetical protein
MVVRAAAVETPARSALGLGEWGNGGGDECGEEGHPGVGGEWAAAVVRHNGMKAAVSEGNCPGWWWGVMRSRCSGRYGSGGGASRRRVRT